MKKTFLLIVLLLCVQVNILYHEPIKRHDSRMKPKRDTIPCLRRARPIRHPPSWKVTARFACRLPCFAFDIRKICPRSAYPGPNQALTGLLLINFVPEDQKNTFMIQTGNPVISIYTEMTPNPETMKFVANKLLYPGKSIDFADETLSGPSPLAKELFSFPFIKSVFIASNFVTLTKTLDTEDWQDVIPAIKTFLKDYLENGGVVVNDEEVAKVKQEASNTVSADDDDIVKRVKELLENYVKPAVEMDGGAIQFKSYNEGTVNLMLQGSCSGCPSSMITLKAGIEGMMKRMIPEVKEVVAEAE